MPTPRRVSAASGNTARPPSSRCGNSSTPWATVFGYAIATSPDHRISRTAVANGQSSFTDASGTATRAVSGPLRHRAIASSGSTNSARTSLATRAFKRRCERAATASSSFGSARPKTPFVCERFAECWLSFRNGTAIIDLGHALQAELRVALDRLGTRCSASPM